MDHTFLLNYVQTANWNQLRAIPKNLNHFTWEGDIEPNSVNGCRLQIYTHCLKEFIEANSPVPEQLIDLIKTESGWTKPPKSIWQTGNVIFHLFPEHWMQYHATANWPTHDHANPSPPPSPTHETGKYPNTSTISTHPYEPTQVIPLPSPTSPYTLTTTDPFAPSYATVVKSPPKTNSSPSTNITTNNSKPRPHSYTQDKVPRQFTFTTPGAQPPSPTTAESTSTSLSISNPHNNPSTITSQKANPLPQFDSSLTLVNPKSTPDPAVNIPTSVSHPNNSIQPPPSIISNISLPTPNPQQLHSTLPNTTTALPIHTQQQTAPTTLPTPHYHLPYTLCPPNLHRNASDPSTYLSNRLLSSESFRNQIKSRTKQRQYTFDPDSYKIGLRDLSAQQLITNIWNIATNTETFNGRDWFSPLSGEIFSQDPHAITFDDIWSSYIQLNAIDQNQLHADPIYGTILDLIFAIFRLLQERDRKYFKREYCRRGNTESWSQWNTRLVRLLQNTQYCKLPYITMIQQCKHYLLSPQLIAKLESLCQTRHEFFKQLLQYESDYHSFRDYNYTLNEQQKHRAGSSNIICMDYLDSLFYSTTNNFHSDAQNLSTTQSAQQFEWQSEHFNRICYKSTVLNTPLNTRMHEMQLTKVKENMGPPLTLQALVETLDMVLDVSHYRRSGNQPKLLDQIPTPTSSTSFRNYGSEPYFHQHPKSPRTQPYTTSYTSSKYIHDRPRTPASPARNQFNSHSNYYYERSKTPTLSSSTQNSQYSYTITDRNKSQPTSRNQSPFREINLIERSTKTNIIPDQLYQKIKAAIPNFTKRHKKCSNTDCKSRRNDHYGYLCHTLWKSEHKQTIQTIVENLLQQLSDHTNQIDPSKLEAKLNTPISINDLRQFSTSI